MSEDNSGEQAAKEVGQTRLVRVIASNQRHIIWLLLVSVLCYIVPHSHIAIGMLVLTGLFSIFLVYQTAQALGLKNADGLLVLSFMPIVKLLVLLYVNGKATKFLRSHGVRVGLTGANKNDLVRVLQRE